MSSSSTMLVTIYIPNIVSMVGISRMFCKLHKNSVAYAATTLAAHLMNSVFQFYYVKLFLTHYKITDFWFNTAQVLYMVWNAINDPLFGYFQDYSNLSCLKERRLNILYGGPLFVISFLLPWFGWVSEDSPDWVAGIHLLVSLACYDCMFTFVLLAQCSLFAEMSRNNEERERLVLYSSVAAIMGTSAVLITEISSDHMKSISGLQFTCMIIACMSGYLFSYTGRNVVTDVNRSDLSSKEEEQSCRTAVKTSFEIIKNKNFVAFVMINFLQILHSTFCGNFFSIFREKLVPSDSLPSIMQSFLAGTAFMFPHLLVLLLNKPMRKYGSYKMIKVSFVIKITMAILLYVAGRQHFLLISLFMVLDNTCVGAASCLFNLPVSFIIDDDQNKYNRKNPVSSMVFGINALITKPAQSVAPMLIVHLLKQSGYNPGDKKGFDAPDALKDSMFNIMVFIPVILGVSQLIIWNMFRLRSKPSEIV